MKRGLISKLENGRICDVVDAGSEFETTEDFFWVDLADDVTTSDRYDLETKEIIYFDPAAHPGFIQNGYLVARAIAYGSVGEQMDMMFKEIQSTGTISPDGPWATHVAKVKADIPKDDPQAVYAYVKADWERRQAELAAQQQQ